MDTLRITGRWLIWGTGALLLAALLGASAVTLISAHGGDGSLIHACINNRTGLTRIVDASDSCRSQETAVDWNAVGPQGPQGDTGAQGPTGPAGPPGPQGGAGLSGYERVSGSFHCSPLFTCGLRVTCPGGKKVLGGGVTTGGFNVFSPDVLASYPRQDSLWTIMVKNHEPFVGIDITAWAVCAFTD